MLGKAMRRVVSASEGAARATAARRAASGALGRELSTAAKSTKWFYDAGSPSLEVPPAFWGSYLLKPKFNLTTHQKMLNDLVSKTGRAADDFASAQDDFFHNVLMKTTVTKDLVDFRNALSMHSTNPAFTFTTEQVNAFLKRPNLPPTLVYQFYMLFTEQIGVVPDVETFGTVLSALASSGFWDQFFYVSSDMRFRNVAATGEMLERMIPALASRADRSDSPIGWVEQTLSTLLNQPGVPLPASTLGPIFDYLLYVKKFHTVSDIFSKLAARSDAQAEVLYGPAMVGKVGVALVQNRKDGKLVELCKAHLRRCDAQSPLLCTVSSNSADHVQWLRTFRNTQLLVTGSALHASAEFCHIATIFVARALGSAKLDGAVQIWKAITAAAEANLALDETARAQLRGELLTNIARSFVRKPLLAHTTEAYASFLLPEILAAPSAATAVRLTSDLVNCALYLGSLVRPHDVSLSVVFAAIQQRVRLGEELLVPILDALSAKGDTELMMQICKYHYSGSMTPLSLDKAQPKKGKADWMRRPGAPTPKTLSRVLFAMVQAGDADLAQGLVTGGLQARGFKPRLADFHSVIMALAHSGQSERALELFTSCHDEHRDLEIYTDAKLIEGALMACVRGRLGDRALQIFEKASAVEYGNANPDRFHVAFKRPRAACQVMAALSSKELSSVIPPFLNSLRTSVPPLALSNSLVACAWVMAKQAGDQESMAAVAKIYAKQFAGEELVVSASEEEEIVAKFLTLDV